ncbi:protein of unknown function (plasmid) [Methylocella tundrae]|uniref:Rrf2 family transcriptional regulator n=1 Tax=Methylocella tundrae TaxID=227605 RepID=A0A4U8Z8C7_METTU|nr:protein of unknown function [Methylocella tundrae]
MKLTSYSNYCLRVLMVAAARSPDLTTIQDVAIGFGVSKAHLVKCAHQLGTCGGIWRPCVATRAAFAWRGRPTPSGSVK